MEKLNSIIKVKVTIFYISSIFVVNLNIFILLIEYNYLKYDFSIKFYKKIIGQSVIPKQHIKLYIFIIFWLNSKIIVIFGSHISNNLQFFYFFYFSLTF